MLPTTILNALLDQLSASFISEVPCAIPNMGLYRIRANTREAQGMLLLQGYETADADSIEKQQRAVERSASGLYLSSPTNSLTVEGYVGIVTEVGEGIHQLQPLTRHLSAESSDFNLPHLHAIMQNLTDRLRAWNPARDLQDKTRGGFAWLKDLTPFSERLDVPSTVIVNQRALRNPVAWAIDETRWQQAHPIMMPMGYGHGQLEAKYIYTVDTRPILMDVRGFERNAPILLDWAGLELSFLLAFMLPRQQWQEWEALCEVMGASLLPNKRQTRGLIAPHAVELITPLRAAIQAYMEAMPKNLREWVEAAYWFSLTVAALRHLADPNTPDCTRQATLAYGASAFERLAHLIDLPKTSQPTSLVLLPETPLTMHIPQRRRPTPQPFPHGYALLIGVGNTQNPKYALPITRDDAVKMGDFLTQEVGYLPAQVKVLTDKDTSISSLEQGFNWLKTHVQNDPDATALVYYSGHGMEDNNNYFLIPYEFNHQQYKRDGQTALPMPQFEQWLREIRAPRLAVFLDCCHAGGAGISKDLTEMLEFTPKSPNLDLLQGSGRALIASSTASQVSYILGGHANSLFTEVLLEGLGQKGTVTIFNLFEYVRREVGSRAKTIGREQHPRFNAADLDTIILADNS